MNLSAENKITSIPVIDIFAGPGGLAEGFSALHDENHNRIFKIALSIEKDRYAHETLTLRSFFRQFQRDKIPEAYYDFLKQKISIEELYKRYPEQSRNAKEEAWLAELGEGKNAVSNDEVDKKITTALKFETDWLLIGGPPCQAYSVVGRSRRQQKILDEKKDERVGLYKQYLRILAIHNPPVFVMENVKGLLSAETKESLVFSKILGDLKNPVEAYELDYGKHRKELICPGYNIYSLTARPRSINLFGEPEFEQDDYLIYTEKFGIPQTRHRVILLGVRKNISSIPDILNSVTEVPICQVLKGLPKLRGGLSKSKDKSGTAWKNVLKQIVKNKLIDDADKKVQDRIRKHLKHLSVPQKEIGGEYIPYSFDSSEYRPDWFIDKNIDGVCNHVSRGHMESDIQRYFFVLCFAKVHGRSPKLEDFPKLLLPDHENVNEGVDKIKFGDRFRVQLWNKPSKTITSHISKDGHYYIHPDPMQCRSFTVREAARIQTFPDNYFFSGPRTSQFIQIGNAVPPLLAFQIAGIVAQILIQEHEYKTNQISKLPVARI